MCEYSIKDSRGTNTAHGSIRFRACMLNSEFNRYSVHYFSILHEGTAAASSKST